VEDVKTAPETGADEKGTAEFMISARVLRAAKARAATQDREITVVAKAILIKLSKNATPLIDEEGKPTEPAHPATREPGEVRKRIRFSVDPDEHEGVKERIRASGISMTAALETALEIYSRTGKY
jgi:hypothetical protein